MQTACGARFGLRCGEYGRRGLLPEQWSGALPPVMSSLKYSGGLLARPELREENRETLAAFFTPADLPAAKIQVSRRQVPWSLHQWASALRDGHRNPPPSRALCPRAGHSRSGR